MVAQSVLAAQERALSWNRAGGGGGGREKGRLEQCFPNGVIRGVRWAGVSAWTRSRPHGPVSVSEGQVPR